MQSFKNYIYDSQEINKLNLTNFKILKNLNNLNLIIPFEINLFGNIFIIFPSLFNSFLKILLLSEFFSHINPFFSISSSFSSNSSVFESFELLFLPFPWKFSLY